MPLQTRLCYKCGRQFEWDGIGAWIPLFCSGCPLATEGEMITTSAPGSLDQVNSVRDPLPAAGPLDQEARLNMASLHSLKVFQEALDKSGLHIAPPRKLEPNNE
jgi:hypothetical protein